MDSRRERGEQCLVRGTDMADNGHANEEERQTGRTGQGEVQGALGTIGICVGWVQGGGFSEKGNVGGDLKGV